MRRPRRSSAKCPARSSGEPIVDRLVRAQRQPAFSTCMIPLKISRSPLRQGPGWFCRCGAIFHQFVTKTQPPPRQFAKTIDLICAGCRIRTGAVGIWVAIEFGAISGATWLLHQAANSTIRAEDVSARRCPVSTLRIVIWPDARASSPSGSSSPLDGRRIGCGDGWLTVGTRKPSQFSRQYGRLFGAPPARDIAWLLAAGGRSPAGRT